MSQVDSLMAELGLDELGISLPTTSEPVKVAPPSGPGASSGPGRAVSAGPGVSSGPGRGVSSGPGISSGPGAKRAPAAAKAPQMLGKQTPDGRAVTHNGPPCYACGKIIVGRVTNAFDRTYHPECFSCKNCNKQFGGKRLVFASQFAVFVFSFVLTVRL